MTIQFAYRNILLRNTHMEDLDRYHNWFGDLNNWCRAGDPWGDQAYTEDEVRQMVESNVQSVTDSGPLTLEICNQEGQHFGSVEYRPQSAQEEAGAVAIRICDPEFQGHGYGESALKGFLTWLFGEKKVSSVSCTVREGNRPMKRLISKCGFRLNQLHTDKFIFSKGKEDLLHFQIDSALLFN